MNLIEFTIKKIGPKKVLSSKEEIEKILISDKRGFEYKIPDNKFNTHLIKESINKTDVIHFVNENAKIVIYLHGGGYYKQANILHYNFANQLFKNGIDVYFPIYPLIPNTYINTYEMLLKLYKKLLLKEKEIIIIGDSAGGGLALGFTQYLNEKKLKTPSKLILISPWVDVSMENLEMQKYEKKDPMLSIEGLKQIGKYWAGDLSVKNYKISPIYGNFKNIPQTFIYTGTKEILYPDSLLLYNKLKENNVKCKLIVGSNMNHIYPLFPIIGKTERKQIINILGDEHENN